MLVRRLDGWRVVASRPCLAEEFPEVPEPREMIELRRNTGIVPGGAYMWFPSRSVNCGANWTMGRSGRPDSGAGSAGNGKSDAVAMPPWYPRSENWLSTGMQSNTDPLASMKLCTASTPA
jgi:hypothetical protein